jgi:hypothetical protein
MKPSEIVIHHSAGEDRPDLQWNEIRAWHTQQPPDGLGFSDIGYHAGIEFVELSEEILMGRPWDKKGAHCLGHNQISLGLCFVGDFNKYAPRPAALKTGARIVALWIRLFGIPLGKIYRHDSLNATDCPGRLFDLTAFLNLIQEER